MPVFSRQSGKAACFFQGTRYIVITHLQKKMETGRKKAMKQCPNCNFKTPRNNDLFCAICGAKLKTIPDVSVCKHCGTELYPNARFCTKCGEQPSVYGPTMSAAGGMDSEISISVMPGKEVPPESMDISAGIQNEMPAPDFISPGTPNDKTGAEISETTKPSPAAEETTLVARCEVFEPTALTTKVFVDPPETVQFVQGEGAPSSRILSREEIRTRSTRLRTRLCR